MGKQVEHWTAWGALLMLVFASPVLLFALVFRDYEDVAPGSLAWHFVLPGFLTAAPLPAACGEPHYSSYPIDGLKPGEESVRFKTRASLAGLRAAYTRELAGCRPSPDGADGARFECEGSQYQAVILSLDPGDGCRQARIAFRYY
jgi:hypothetical protein